MLLLRRNEYLKFLAKHSSITVGGQEVELVKKWNIKEFGPKNFAPEAWTVWSFEDRGDWATHRGNYRGNWSPFIPRNLIDRYTKPGDMVCDPMVGSGTTLVECKLLGRNSIGVDINPNAAMIAMNRLDFALPDDHYKVPKADVYIGDARNLDAISDGEIDLVATHPPYWGIIPYSKAVIPGDLSSLNLKDFIFAIGEVAKECYRILKPDGHCGILMGDTRMHRHYVPIHVGILNKFLDAGFVLQEEIIKLQHGTKTTRERWGGGQYDFFKIAHEHLYVFRKLSKEDKLQSFKYSLKWW
ncbi:MAG: methyltransferase domain-containing protein [Nitrososphaerota archaeon]|nr:methyltransferase domain-containing protein [Nitrososphaerota archaeon]